MKLAYHATLKPLHQASNHPSADVRLSADEVMAIVRDEVSYFWRCQQVDQSGFVVLSANDANGLVVRISRRLFGKE